MNIKNIARQMQLTNATNQVNQMIPSAAEIASDADSLAQTKTCIASLKSAVAALETAVNNPPQA